MSIEGRINVDVLFHDKDGTASLKVLSLQDSQQYSGNKVAIVSGTCGTARVTLNLLPTAYANASGQSVSIPSVARVAFRAGSVNGAYVYAQNGAVITHSREGRVSVAEHGAEDDFFEIASLSGSTSWTIVLYGVDT
jgi:hypothetical protein